MALSTREALELELLELEEEQYQHEYQQRQKQSAPEPIAPAPAPNLPGEEATFGQESANVAAGFAEGLYGLQQLPGTVARFVTQTEKPVIQSEDVTKPHYQNPVSKWLGGKVQEGIDWARKPRVDPKANPVSSALRTGAEFVNPGGFSNLSQNVVNLAGTVGPAALDYLGNTTEVFDDAPGWVKPALQVVSSIGGSSATAKALRPTTNVNAVAAIDRADSGLDVANLRQQLSDEVKGTLGDYSGSPDIRNLEESITKGSSGQRLLDASRAARLDQQVGDVSGKFGDADPMTAQRTAIESATQQRGLVEARNQAEQLSIAERGATDIEGANTVLTQAMADLRATQQQALLQRQADTSDIAAGEIAQNSLLRKAQEAEAAQLLKTENLERAGTPKLSPDEASKGVYDAVNAKDAVSYDIQKSAWNELDKSGKTIPAIEVEALKKTLSDSISDLSPAARADFEQIYSKEMGQIGDWKADETIKELGYIKHKLGEFAANAHKSDVSSVHTVKAGNMSRIIDSFLSAHPSYKDAVAKTKYMYDTTRSTFLRPAMTNEAYETLIKRMQPGEEGGAYLARVLSRSEAPGAMENFGDYLRAKAYNREGGVNEAFMRTHKPALNNFPDLQAELSQIVRQKSELGSRVATTKQTKSDTAAALRELSSREKASTAALDRAEGEFSSGSKSAEAEQLREMKSIGARTKQAQAESSKVAGEALTSIKGKVATQYADAPEATMKSLLHSPDKTEDLARLHGGLPSNADKASFKSHAKNQLLDTATNEKAFSKINKKTRDRLVDSGVVSRSDMDDIETIIRQTEADNLARSKAKGGIPNDRLSDIDLLKSTLQAQAVAGATGTGSHLFVVGQLRQFIKKRRAKKKYPPKVARRVEEFLADPEKYLKAFDNVKNRDTVATLFMNKIYATAQGVKDTKEE